MFPRRIKLFLVLAIVLTLLYDLILLFNENNNAHVLLRNDNTSINVAKLLKKENEIDKLDRRIPKFSHYFLHITKAGGEAGTQMLNSDVKMMTSVRNHVCNMATSVNSIENWARWEKQKEQKRCIMFSSEGHYIPGMDYASYTIVRSPVEHVLSMFFHCTEAIVHKDRFQFMPSLDEWLETWIAAMRSGDEQRQQRLDKTYQCFNIINHQSTKLGLNEDPSNKEELKRRFAVVGITSSLAKSTCLIAIKLTGIVPSRCNCTNSDNEHRNANEKRITHGVKHHGSSFKPSSSQLAAIKLLTEKDQLVYENAKEYFEEQVEYIQRERGFTLCN